MNYKCDVVKRRRIQSEISLICERRLGTSADAVCTSIVDKQGGARRSCRTQMPVAVWCSTRATRWSLIEAALMLLACSRRRCVRRAAKPVLRM